MDCSRVEAEVVGVESGGFLRLQVSPRSACVGCSGLCLWQRRGELRICCESAAAQVVEGSRVAVRIPSELIVQSSLMLYGLPLALLLLGALAGSLVLESDAGSLIGAIAGLVVAYGTFGSLRVKLERKALRELKIRVVL